MTEKELKKKLNDNNLTEEDLANLWNEYLETIQNAWDFVIEKLETEDD